MENDHKLYLWRCYQEQRSDGGPARDNLAYTPHFDVICLRLNTRFATSYSPDVVFSELSYLDRHTEQRRRLGIEEAADA